MSANASTAVSLKEEHVNTIMRKVHGFQRAGELDLPPDYSVGNALNAAWLILQQTTDRNGKPVLATCTRESIANSLLDMCVQGLNPGKKQGYFIAYGDKLCFQRSYFGAIAVLKRVNDRVADVIAEVVYDGDEFKFSLVRGRKEITTHEQTLESMASKSIRAAYAQVIAHDGSVLHTELMAWADILQAWRQSKQNPFNDDGTVKTGSVHGKFTSDMAKRTVINKACKILINSSNDRSTMLGRAIERSAEPIAEIAAEVKERAGTGPTLSIVPPNDGGDAVQDAEFEEQKAELTESEPTPLNNTPDWAE